LVLGPVLVFFVDAVAFAAGAFGVSVVRTPPQGSEADLASGIFLKVSL
jgi:hypothetical protein